MVAAAVARRSATDDARAVDARGGDRPCRFPLDEHVDEHTGSRTSAVGAIMTA
jgi:hypothetical protein